MFNAIHLALLVGIKTLKCLSFCLKFTDSQFSQIYSYYRFTVFTDSQFLQIYSYYRFTVITDSQLLQIYRYYKFTVITDLGITDLQLLQCTYVHILRHIYFKQLSDGSMMVDCIRL